MSGGDHNQGGGRVRQIVEALEDSRIVSLALISGVPSPLRAEWRRDVALIVAEALARGEASS